MKLITSNQSSILLYTSETPLEAFYMIKDRPDVEKGDILVVPKAIGNTILHNNLGFVPLSGAEAVYTAASTLKEEEIIKLSELDLEEQRQEMLAMIEAKKQEIFELSTKIEAVENQQAEPLLIDEEQADTEAQTDTEAQADTEE